MVKGIRMKTGINGLNLIKHFEQLRLKAYLDSVKVPTIGWGHTKGVNMGDSVTEDVADKLLQSDLFTAERAVDAAVFAALNQNQFDALVSFTFNLGEGALNRSTLLKELNAGNYYATANNFLKWVYAGSNIEPGLVKRRQAESKLFMTPIAQPFSI